MAVFLFGTLRDASLRGLVLGGDAIAGLSAFLPDHASCWPGPLEPVLLMPRGGAAAEGLLLDGIGGDQARRLERFCAVFGLTGRMVGVQTASGPARAMAYGIADLALAGQGAFALDAWRAHWGAAALRLAGEIVARLESAAPGDVARHLTQAKARAVSWVRAQVQPQTQTQAQAQTQAGVVTHGPGAGLCADAVETVDRRLAYTEFFQVEERDLRFPTFGGTLSEVVTRAGFVMGDAVTVLPYDPRRDRVLLVEQFRAGPFMRGDPAPWSLEPVAGRIDPGESPEQAARREAREEAGLELGALSQVARYYPSPGAVTEYLYSYVGIADLPEDAARIGGLAAEAEDIRGVLLDFGALMDLIAGTGSAGESGSATRGESGNRAGNAPLILTGWWLAAHRDRLRRGA